MANNVDTDQTTPFEEFWSGSALFVYAILPDTFVYENFGHLPLLYGNMMLFQVQQTVFACQTHTVKSFCIH